MRRMAPFFLILLVALLNLGCGTQKDLVNTDAAVSKFHAQLDAGNFTQIYADSDQAMKDAASQQKFVDLLSAIHRKLGAVKNANRQGFFVHWGTSGKTIRVNYATQFDADNAAEEFVFLASGDDIRLVGYHINSDALVTK
jgi:Protein of unknown function (DUF4019)